MEINKGRAAITGFCCMAEYFEKDNMAVPGIHEDIKQDYDSICKLNGLAY